MSFSKIHCFLRLFDCHNPKGIKLITRFRLSLSHLCEHKFKHSFQGCLNPICTAGIKLKQLRTT